MIVSALRDLEEECSGSNFPAEPPILTKSGVQYDIEELIRLVNRINPLDTPEEIENVKERILNKLNTMGG